MLKVAKEERGGRSGGVDEAVSVPPFAFINWFLWELKKVGCVLFG